VLEAGSDAVDAPVEDEVADRLHLLDIFSPGHSTLHACGQVEVGPVRWSGAWAGVGKQSI